MLTFPALAIAYLVRSFSFSASNLNHNKLLNTTIYVQRTATIRYIKCSFKKTRRTTTTSSNNHLRLLQVIIMKCQLIVCCTYPFPSDVLFSGLSWHHHAPFSAWPAHLRVCSSVLQLHLYGFVYYKILINILYLSPNQHTDNFIKGNMSW